MSSRSDDGGVSASRPITVGENRLLSALFEGSYPGREALVEQANGILVTVIDADGSLQLHPTHGPKAQVERRIPVEAEIDDEDGTVVHILLHVLDGMLSELEIFREDSSPLQRPINPETVRLLIL